MTEKITRQAFRVKSRTSKLVRSQDVSEVPDETEELETESVTNITTVPAFPRYMTPRQGH